MPSAPPASLNASIAGDSPPNSLPASQLPSRCASPLRTRLDQPHTFAASLNTTGRQPTKPSECPTHYYQIDNSIGRQLESKDASQPSWGFGSADRWASYNKELKANTTPGPGSYDPVA